MSLTEILDAVERLSPTDRAKVVEALTETASLNNEADLRRRQHELHLSLLAEGRLKRLPDRKLKRRESRPVKIKGKPLSETIIEERR